MRTELTLRYLLLRHLKRFDGAVPRPLFLEATRSLHVAVERDAYVVTWDAGGRRHSRSFPLSAFTFYGRGDRPDAVQQNDDNSALGRAFAEEVFGAPTPAAPVGDRLFMEPYWQFGMLEATLLVLLLATLGALRPLAALALLIAALIEHVRGGRVYSSAAFVLLAATGPPAAGVVGAVTYGMLQFVDPNVSRRTLRVGVCSVAAAVAAFRVASASASLDLSVALVAVAGLAFIAVLLRSLYGAHFRALPLALPLYCLGLYLDHHVAASVAGVIFMLIATAVIARLHQWLPVQRERVLTANG